MIFPSQKGILEKREKTHVARVIIQQTDPNNLYDRNSPIKSTGSVM